MILNVPPDHPRQRVAFEPLHHNQRVESNQAFGDKGWKEMLVDSPHDGDEAVIAVLAVDRGRQEVLDIALVAAERVKQALESGRADTWMTPSEVLSDLNLSGNGSEALVEAGDDPPGVPPCEGCPGNPAATPTGGARVRPHL